MRKKEIINFIKTFSFIIIFSILMAVLFGCRTKKLNIDIQKESASIDRVNKIDSVFEVEKKENSVISNLETTEIKSFFEDFNLEYLPNFDKSEPFTYLERKGKDTIRFISISGTANLTKKTQTTNLGQNLSKNNSTQIDLSEKGKVKSQSKLKQKEKTFSKRKERNVKATGFQAGFWLWLIIIVIAIILFNYFYKYLNNKNNFLKNIFKT